MIVTGKGGSSGSWAIRGDQLGRAIGATVKPMATVKELRKHDLIVAVKKVPEPLLEAIRESGRPWVYDVVDVYPQPRCSHWTKDYAIAWMRAHLSMLKPTAVVWPNRKMQEDVGFDGPQTVLYHHARPNARINPIRQNIQAIGYEGCERYLGSWRRYFDRECERRGWRFVVNPQELADLDVVVAFRDGEWSGYCQRHWKSNVKLANAQATGTPFIGLVESGYAETSSGAEYFVDTEQQVSVALDWLLDAQGRESISRVMQDFAPRIGTVANEYRAWLDRLSKS